MATRIGGNRRKARHKITKKIREKGKISIRKYFQTLNNGDRVVLKSEPAVQKGCYHMRFHASNGKVIGKKGACYEVEIKDGNKKKTLIVHPVHLKKLN